MHARTVSDHRLEQQRLRDLRNEGTQQVSEASAFTRTSAGTPESPVPTINDLEVVVVSYRSRHHVETLLTGWPHNLAVAVVDNSADVDRTAELADRFSNVRYLSGGGQGYARAANLGAFSSGKPYVVFVNPDCRPSPEQLVALVRGIAGDVGAISHAATPITPHGGIEIGVGGWEPSIGRALVHASGLHKFFPRAGLYAHPRVGEHVKVDWVTGTCLAVRRGPFSELGGFDDAFFVYCEDVAFGHRARKNGWRIRLREDVLVPHGTGSSGAPSSEMRRLQGASFATYTSRYSGSAARGVAIRALYVMGASWRVVVLTLAGRREQATATRNIIRGVVTHKAFVGGTEVARARANEVDRVVLAGGPASRSRRR
jgi:GT2 family glycosyltransferase